MVQSVANRALALWAGLRHVAVPHFGVRRPRAGHVPSSRVTRGRLVVVASTAEGVSPSSRDHQYQADDDQNDAARRKEAADSGVNEQSDKQEDDSEDDHDVYLVSMVDGVVQKYLESGGQCLTASFSLAPACLVLPLN